MSAETIAEAGVLHGGFYQPHLSSIRSTLALSALAAGIAINLAWISTVGWFSLRVSGVL